MSRVWWKNLFCCFLAADILLVSKDGSSSQDVHQSTNDASTCMEKPLYFSYFAPSFSVNFLFCWFIIRDSPFLPPPSDLSFTAILVCFLFRLLLTPNVVLVSNRLSSLTIGDSERRSSSAQQKDPSADLPAESAGTFSVYF